MEKVLNVDLARERKRQRERERERERLADNTHEFYERGRAYRVHAVLIRTAGVVSVVGWIELDYAVT